MPVLISEVKVEEERKEKRGCRKRVERKRAADRRTKGQSAAPSRGGEISPHTRAGGEGGEGGWEEEVNPAAFPEPLGP